MTQEKISYSLWLRPVQTQIDGFTKIISRLAHQHHTISFPPHITLLPSISADTQTIKKTCEKFVRQQNTFDILLKNISYTKYYFRNLFILADLNKELKQLFENAKSEFGIESTKIYVPHLSLLYGQLSKSEQEKLQKELKESYSKIFKCSRLDIYNTSGKENEWYLIGSFPFHN